MMLKFRFYHFIYIAGIAVFSVQCSSKHKTATEQDTGIGKVYHNVTAKNNGYFNAKIKFNSATEQFAENLTENYQDILPIYQYGTFESSQSLAPTMDEVIKKTSVAIQLHPNSKWADDCYMLMGKAHFMKQNYNEAIQVFQYINRPTEKEVQALLKKTRQKSKNNAKKRVLSDTHPDAIKAAQEAADKELLKEETQALKAAKYGFLSHKPVKYDAITWLLKSFIDQKKYSDALSVISLVKTNEAIPRKLIDDFYVEHARYFLKQKDYEGALAPLDSAIQYSDNKKLETRLSFIKAQIHSSMDQNEEAAALYQDVLKLKPNFEMEFQTRLQLAQTGMLVDQDDQEKTYSSLAKMAKDEKYDDYKDQVYFTMGKIALASEDTTNAINFFNQSTINSTVNRNQKGLSFLKLAEIYFAQEAYTTSQAFYDSTVTFLSKDHSQYPTINNTKKVLSKVVRHINTIEREDSLQFLASRPQREIDAAIFDIIEAWDAKKQAEAEAKAIEVSNRNNFDPNNINNNNNRNNPRNNSSTWYFYNNNVKSIGFNEFIRVWGERELEDNWRRAAKSLVIADEEEEAEEELLEDVVDPNVRPTKEALLANLPFTEEEVTASNDKIIHAYFSLGNIYKDELNNDPLAINAFKMLNRRYPDNKHEVVSLYNLYLLHNFSDQQAEANTYKTTIIQKYPDSDYAKLLEDPTYYETIRAQENAASQFYAATYNYYLDNDYIMVMQRKAEADSTFNNEIIQPKFDFLATQVIGKTKDKKSYLEALQNIVRTYPDHEVKTRSQEIIDLLTREDKSTENTSTGTNEDPKNTEGETSTEPKDKGEETAPKEIVKPIDTAQFSTKDEAHYGLIFVHNPAIQVTSMVSELSDYNARNHSLDRLKVSRMIFAKGIQVIVIKQMKDKETAGKYFDGFQIREEALLEIEKKDYDFVMISKTNYVKIFRNKDVASYLAFFEENF